MLSFFFSKAASFPLKGVWNFTYTDYNDEIQNARLRINAVNTTFVGKFRFEEFNKMIPKKIHIKELVVDKRYVLILPFSQNPKFCELWFSNETGVLQANSNSTDNKWDVTATVSPGKKMELLLQKIGKKNWYKYTATPIEKSTSMVKTVQYTIVAIVVVVIFVIIKSLTSIKKKTD